MPKQAGVLDVVEAYIAARPVAHRAALQKLRATLRKALPGCTEGLSYGIPVFKRDGRMVMYFAAFKAHYAVYPATAGVLEALGAAATPYRSGKATLRFSFEKPLPLRLVTRFAKVRSAEAEVAAAKAAARKGARKTKIS